jgi:hypothetical protein
MATIVEYSGHKKPENRYPERIISPPHSGPCCFTDMQEIGEPQHDARWVFQYKRCRRCGFAVRVILREIPNAALVAELRQTLANAFVRGFSG